MWLVYSSPAAYYNRSVCISGSEESATDTKECSLIRAVTLINTTTYVASPRGIARVNGHDWHTGKFGLVLDLLAQVIESPRGMLPSLAFLNRRSLSDTLQIFQGNTERVPLSLFNYPLGYFVVFLRSHPALFAPSLFKQAPGLVRSLALQLLSKFSVTLAEAVKVVSGVGFAQAISRKIFDTQVNTEKFFNILRLWDFLFTSGKEIENTVNKNKVAFTSLMLKQLKLTLTSDKGNGHSASKRPNAYRLPIDIPAQDSIIVGNRTKPVKFTLGFSIELIGIGNLANTACNHLGGQISGLTHIPINQLMKLELAKGTGFPSNRTDIIASGISRIERFKQGLMLLWVSLQLDFGRKFHTNSIAYCQIFDKWSMFP